MPSESLSIKIRFKDKMSTLCVRVYPLPETRSSRLLSHVSTLILGLEGWQRRGESRRKKTRTDRSWVSHYESNKENKYQT